MKKKEKKVDDDVLAFLIESREILEDVVPQIIRLGERLESSQTADKETVNYIFRAFHTIKGTSAFYQFNNVVAVTHKAETLLEFFRRGSAAINVSCTDILCNACDVTDKLLDLIETTGEDVGIEEEVRSIIYRLNGRINIFRDRKDLSENDELQELVAGADSGSKQLSAPKKIGENTRIFVNATRDTLIRIEELVKTARRHPIQDFDANGETFEELLSSLDLISETAGFLEFNSMMDLLQSLIDYLSSLRDTGYSITIDDLDVLSSSARLGKQILETIEDKGVDRGFNDPIDQLADAMSTVRPLPSKKENDEITPAVDKQVKEPETTSDDYVVSSKIQDLFIGEAFDQLDRIDHILMSLKSDPTNKGMISDVFSILHSLKGSCGILNYGDPEQLILKLQTLLESSIQGTLELDPWDIKAIWFICGIVRKTVQEIANGGTGKIINLTVLDCLLDFIAGSLSAAEKEAKIQLPAIGESRDDVLMDEDVLSDNANTLEKDVMDTLMSRTGTGGDQVHWVTDSDIDELAGDDIENHDMAMDAGFHRRQGERRDIRVNLEKLDELINLIGELVIAENMVVKNPDVSQLHSENFDRASMHLSKIVRDLQDVALSVRMIPISGVFRKMIRLVHDLSVKSGKKIGLRLIGENTEIDKTVAELIADPLVHLVRNAVDHGIQKQMTDNPMEDDGKIELEARHEGGEVWVIVRDNGQGLDRDKIVKKGISAGLVDGDGSGLSDTDIDDLIFQPGFSTSESVTDVSGRGVGMDVVKKNIEKIKGHINVYSRKGLGTTFIMRIPLTLAIIDGMLVRVGESSYTIPLLSIRESIQVAPGSVTVTMSGQEMVRVRDELIPVIRLHKLYSIKTACTQIDKGLLVVVEHQRETAGLFIDEIVGEQQTVIKGLSGYMESIRGISGCTILGDGEVSLILDVGGLIKRTYLNDTEFQERMH